MTEENKTPLEALSNTDLFLMVDSLLDKVKYDDEAMDPRRNLMAEQSYRIATNDDEKRKYALIIAQSVAI